MFALLMGQLNCRIYFWNEQEKVIRRIIIARLYAVDEIHLPARRGLVKSEFVSVNLILTDELLIGLSNN